MGFADNRRAVCVEQRQQQQQQQFGCCLCSPNRLLKPVLFSDE